MLYQVPLINELADGDANSHSDCVPACIASALDFLTGRSYTSAGVKDAIYGPSYIGATDPAHFIAYAASQGVRMWQIDGTSAALTSELTTLLTAPGPVLVTGAIPSLWDNDYAGQDMAAYAGSTHEVLWCGWDGVTLSAMNPWQPVVTFPIPPHYQQGPAAWWQERICYGRLFGMELTAMSSVTPIWDAATGTLTYPAHDGLPQIVLDHGQAWYAHTSRNAVYPLAPHFYDAAGNDHCYWSDCLDSELVKANNWAPQLVNVAAVLAGGIGHKDVDTAGIIADAQAIITKASI